VIGATDLYDLAVLKIEGRDLPCTAWRQRRLLVGEWAIAIGNPFGYLLQDTSPPSPSA
jgi:serine protease Do